ncbi:MAG: hypothetical protein J2P56_03800, partial [Verrucomicrobia bacterium]|nr:hypothetical protein [Verrucomicrobiota bacterium]
HQNAHRQKTGEKFTNAIDNQTDFTWHAFDKVLPNKEYGLDCPHAAGMILKQQIMVIEITLDRFLYDLVVTMVFALVVERASPRVAILQLGTCNDLCHALRN